MHDEDERVRLRGPHLLDAPAGQPVEFGRARFEQRVDGDLAVQPFGVRRRVGQRGGAERGLAERGQLHAGLRFAGHAPGWPRPGSAAAPGGRGRGRRSSRYSASNAPVTGSASGSMPCAAKPREPSGAAKPRESPCAGEAPASRSRGAANSGRVVAVPVALRRPGTRRSRRTGSRRGTGPSSRPRRSPGPSRSWRSTAQPRRGPPEPRRDPRRVDRRRRAARPAGPGPPGRRPASRPAPRPRTARRRPSSPAG